MEKEKRTIENCDIFDFMAKHVGLTAIHPGGFNATRMLSESCHCYTGRLYDGDKIQIKETGNSEIYYVGISLIPWDGLWRKIEY